MYTPVFNMKMKITSFQDSETLLAKNYDYHSNLG